MRIYELDPPEGYEWVVPEKQDDFNVLGRFDGSPRASGWTPVRMQLVKEDEGQLFLPSDMPWFGGDAPVLKQKALNALGSALAKDGELLPLSCDETDLWLFNATTVLDALDLKRSDLIRFPSGGIMKVKSYVFRPDGLRDVAVFKVPERSSLFVTEKFVKMAASLTGVGFRLLWEGPSKAA